VISVGDLKLFYVLETVAYLRDRENRHAHFLKAYHKRLAAERPHKGR